MMKVLLFVSAVVIAAQAAVVSKALEDDVNVAVTEVSDLDIVSLEFANSLQYFDLRVDLEIRPISVEIIDQLISFNISETEVTQMETDFATSFDVIQTGVRDLDNRLRQLRNTLGSMRDSLQNSDWNQLRTQERRFRDETAVIHTNYNTTETDLKSSLIILENDLIKTLQNETSEDSAAVLANWNQIIDIFEFAGREVTDWKIVYDVRVENTKNAVDIVLDQVARILRFFVKSDERH